MTPTPASLAAYLHQASQVLGEHATRVEAASRRVKASGKVGVDDFLCLAEAEGSRLRAPASALLMAAEIIGARPEPIEPVGMLGRYLLLLAQVLRREADALIPLRGRAEGDARILVDAVRASLLEQASMASMIATYLGDRAA